MVEFNGLPATPVVRGAGGYFVGGGGGLGPRPRGTLRGGGTAVHARTTCAREVDSDGLCTVTYIGHL